MDGCIWSPDISQYICKLTQTPILNTIKKQFELLEKQISCFLFSKNNIITIKNFKFKQNSIFYSSLTTLPYIDLSTYKNPDWYFGNFQLLNHTKILTCLMIQAEIHLSYDFRSNPMTENPLSTTTKTPIYSDKDSLVRMSYYFQPDPMIENPPSTTTSAPKLM